MKTSVGAGNTTTPGICRTSGKSTTLPQTSWPTAWAVATVYSFSKCSNRERYSDHSHYTPDGWLGSQYFLYTQKLTLPSFCMGFRYFIRDRIFSGPCSAEEIYIYSVQHTHYNMGNCKILEEAFWQATNMRNLCGKLPLLSFLMMLNIFKVNYNALNCIKYDIVSKPHENEPICHAVVSESHKTSLVV